MSNSNLFSLKDKSPTSTKPYFRSIEFMKYLIAYLLLCQSMILSAANFTATYSSAPIHNTPYAQQQTTSKKHQSAISHTHKTPLKKHRAHKPQRIKTLKQIHQVADKKMNAIWIAVLCVPLVLIALGLILSIPVLWIIGLVLIPVYFILYVILVILIIKSFAE